MGNLRLVAGVMVIAGLFVGCQAPTNQLAAYRQAFTEARLAGEEVLLDFAAALVEYEQVKARFDQAAVSFAEIVSCRFQTNRPRPGTSSRAVGSSIHRSKRGGRAGTHGDV